MYVNKMQNLLRYLAYLLPALLALLWNLLFGLLFDFRFENLKNPDQFHFTDHIGCRTIFFIIAP